MPKAKECSNTSVEGKQPKLTHYKALISRLFKTELAQKLLFLVKEANFIAVFFCLKV